MADFQNNNFRQILEQDFTQDKLQDRPPRLATGFPRLDELLGGGISPGLIVLGASPGLGKTTLALQIARNVSAGGTPVLYFSLEMPRERISAKLLSREAFQSARAENGAEYTDRTAAKARFFTADDILSANIFDGEKKALFEQTRTGLLDEEATLVILSGAHLDAEEIVSTTRSFVKQTKTRPLVIVDYLQIIPPKKGERFLNDRQLVEKNLHQMAALAHEEEAPDREGDIHKAEGLPVLLISALNRASYKEKLQMDSFKETGGIEYSADVLLGLQFYLGKDPNAKGSIDVSAEKNRFPRQMQLDILKQRYGRAGQVVPFRYYAEFDYFEEADRPLPPSAQGAAPVAAEVTGQRGPASLSLAEELPPADGHPQETSERSAGKVFLYDPSKKVKLPPPGLTNFANNTLIANDLRYGRKGKPVTIPDPDHPGEKITLPRRKFDGSTYKYHPLQGEQKKGLTEVTLTGELDRFDLYVADAAFSILSYIQSKRNDVPKFSLHQLLKALTSDERPTLTDQRRQLLTESIRRLQTTEIRIDCTQEFLARGFSAEDENMIFEGPLLNVTAEGRYYRFRTGDGIDPMPLYSYARRIGQIASFPGGLLRIGGTEAGAVASDAKGKKAFSDTRDAIMIKRLLAQRVEILRSKKGRSTMHMTKISYISDHGRIGFMADLGYSDRLKGPAWNKKLDDVHEIVLKVVDRFREIGYIPGYTIVEKPDRHDEVQIHSDGIKSPLELFRT